MINNADIKKLLDLFNICTEIRIEMVKLIVRTLRATEFNGYSRFNIDNINTTNMHNWCKPKLTARYGNKEFKLFSTDFEKCWVKLNLEYIIRETIKINS